MRPDEVGNYTAQCNDKCRLTNGATSIRSPDITRLNCYRNSIAAARIMKNQSHFVNVKKKGLDMRFQTPGVPANQPPHQ